ncbi:amidohydrolase family protein [Hyphomonas sp.]|uniref:amidohydrolase family protein n=1 Tax=Hyphomonas sp. TaxID=87 RepID=UPI00391DE9C0
MTYRTSPERRRTARVRAGLSLFGLAAFLAACQLWQAPPRDEADWPAGSAPSVSGKPPVPYGVEGQSLPLKPARTISFETSEGTELSIDVSPDGRTIVFDMMGDIYVLPVDGGTARRLAGGMSLDTQPVYAPDGRSILFLSDRSGAENLWLMDADGGNPRQISPYDDDPVFVSPEWAPDEQSILVSRFWADRNAYELWRFRPVAGDVGEVLRSSKGDEGADVNTLGARFAPDGRAAYFASLASKSPDFDALTSWQIVRRDVATGAEDIVLPAVTEDGITVPRMRPAVSPDGQSLVFAERRGGKTALMVMDIGSGALRQIGETDPDSVLAAMTHDAIPRFDFSPGSLAVFVNRGGRIDRISLETGEAESLPFTVHVEQELGPLVRHPAVFEEGPVQARLLMAPDESPDGRQLAFSALGRIFVSGHDGSGLRALRSGDVRGYQPSWSPDGRSIAYVSWTHEAGGQIRISAADASAHRQLTEEDGFYTHPVFTPDGGAIVVVRSGSEARRTTYMEYGQLRDAELVLIPIDGAAPRVLASGRIGGTPHFAGRADEVLFNSSEGVEAVSLTGAGRRRVTQAAGPNWYFAEGSAPADDLRVSPDGKWALAQIAHQLHLYALDAGEGGVTDLSAPVSRHAQLTDVGADYFGWSDDGAALFWTSGAKVYRLSLADVVFGAGRGGQRAAVSSILVEAPRDEPVGQVLLTGARVLTMADRSAPGDWKDADILIDGARIAVVAPRGVIAAPAGTTTLDVSGAYIIPGLIDAHYHVADIRREVLDVSAWGLRTNLAFGITTLFDPSSLTIDMLTYQDLGEAGEIIGSRLYTTGPAIFDYNDFRTKDQVRAVLIRYRENYRLSNIKQYRAGNRRVRQWIAEVAGELGLTPTTEGALSYKLGITQILDGYSGLEHALPPPVLHSDVTKLFAKSGTSSVLTLMISHGGLRGDKPFIDRTRPFENAKYARFAPDWYRTSRFTNILAHPFCQYHYQLSASSAAEIYRQGGLVGVGAHGDTPGLGTHWELHAYVEGGWSPAEALWAGTMGSAAAIGRDAQLGSLEAGKLADLVILDADPLADIRNTLAIRYVVKNGRIYEDEGLKEVAASR